MAPGCVLVTEMRLGAAGGAYGVQGCVVERDAPARCNCGSDRQPIKSRRRSMAGLRAVGR